MKKNRLAQNKKILHKTSQFQRIPHYNEPFERSSRWAAFLCIKTGACKI
ncbi:hypothetical protein T01_925 [Trichinella spiralis]|uniref:Uncharacterized protein n=1 Tax=Trichinella spiralis TaxID=6334 RepID=A0A0V0Y0N8_TRISP|nr:hypothetical protein T01_925 [Trichinella spiralis]